MDKIDKKWFEQHKGKWIGTAIGFFLGLIFLIAGFWKMLFFALLAGTGFVVGHQLDRKTDMKELLDAVLLDKWMRK